MNITFLIGNGFDINLGLPTRFSDFIRFYSKEDSHDMIVDAMNKDLENWADMESALGAFTQSITQDNLSEFLKSKIALDKGLKKYLSDVESRYNIKIDATGVEEFKNKVYNFYVEFPQKEKSLAERIFSNTKESIAFNFIDFNYTRYLDDIVSCVLKTTPFGTHLSGSSKYADGVCAPMHIHGTLKYDMMIGVNDISQLEAEEEMKNVLAEFMVKPMLNEQFREERIEQAKKIITNSAYILIYGMSLGKTDMLWWQIILDWLKSDKNHRLVIYPYMDSDDLVSATGKQMELRNRCRHYFEMTGDVEQFNSYKNQVIIIPNGRIFTFDKIRMEERNG